jgi:hypothetical protein
MSIETTQEAEIEAKLRWGKECDRVGVSVTPSCFGTTEKTKYSVGARVTGEAKFRHLGFGSSWDDAFLDAEYQDARKRKEA